MGRIASFTCRTALRACLRLRGADAGAPRYGASARFACELTGHSGEPTCPSSTTVLGAATSYASRTQFLRYSRALRAQHTPLPSGAPRPHLTLGLLEHRGPPRCPALLCACLSGKVFFGVSLSVHLLWGAGRRSGVILFCNPFSCTCAQLRALIFHTEQGTSDAGL